MTDDPRVGPLSVVAAKVAADNNYDAHFASFAERTLMETKLFLARYDALYAYTMQNLTALHPAPAPKNPNCICWDTQSVDLDCPIHGLAGFSCVLASQLCPTPAMCARHCRADPNSKGAKDSNT